MRRRVVLCAALVSGAVIAGCAGTTSSDLEVGSSASTTAASSVTGAQQAGGTSTTAAAAQQTSTTAAGQTGGSTGSGQPVTLAFAGDVTFEDGARSLLDNDPATVFGPAATDLSGADLTIVNLETAITSGSGTKANKQFVFGAPPSAFTALKAAGIDVVSMANNHGLDYGKGGLSDTLQAKTAANFPVVGIGNNENEAFAPYITTVKGQKIGIIGATQVIDGSLVDSWTATATQGGVASAKNVDRLVAAVTALRPQVDTVVVMLHWGTEKVTCPNQAQLDLAPKLVQAGADVVVGGHAHRLLGAGYMGAAFVDYGLGNYLFKSTSSGAKATGVLYVTATGRRIDGYDWKPARINGNDQPIPLTGSDATAARSSWDALRSCTKLADAPAPIG